MRSSSFVYRFLISCTFLCLSDVDAGQHAYNWPWNHCNSHQGYPARLFLLCWEYFGYFGSKLEARFRNRIQNSTKLEARFRNILAGHTGPTVRVKKCEICNVWTKCGLNHICKLCKLCSLLWTCNTFMIRQLSKICRLHGIHDCLVLATHKHLRSNQNFHRKLEQRTCVTSSCCCLSSWRVCSRRRS